MKNYIFVTIILFTLFVSSCYDKSKIDEDRIKRDVLSVLYAQVDAWNRGDIEAYMAGYVQSDSLRFASGGSVSYGWTETLSRYKKGYPDRETMGKLIFSGLDVDVLSDSLAMVFGKWQLQRDRDNPNGLFTLLFRNTANGWRIVHDHTSLNRKN